MPRKQSWLTGAAVCVVVLSSAWNCHAFQPAVPGGCMAAGCGPNPPSVAHPSSTRTHADVARAAEKNSGRKGEAGNQVGARETRMGPIGLLVRLGLLFSVVLFAWSRGLFSNAALLGWHLPPALAHNWAVQELLLSEIVFFVSSKMYLDGISARYSGHAQWTLPLPISPSAETFINAVLIIGVLVPLALTLASSTAGVAPTVLCGAFGPYFLFLAVQLMAWRALGFRNSVAWPLVPIPFTAWRLAQLWRMLQWLSIANAPPAVLGAISYVVVPSWALFLLGHLFMLPKLYRWPLRDESFVTNIGPLPTRPRQVIEDEGTKVLDQVAELSVQAEKLRVRAALLRKMQTEGGK